MEWQMNAVTIPPIPNMSMYDFSAGTQTAHTVSLIHPFGYFAMANLSLSAYPKGTGPDKDCKT